MKRPIVFRDGYNRTNLRLASKTWPRGWEISFWATDEPWDGPRVGMLIRVGGHWIKWELTWR